MKTSAFEEKATEEQRSRKRSRLIKRNILFAFCLRGWSGIVYLALIAITLRCLGIYENGIWLAISSIIVWIDTMDLGLGNGLRNTLASAMAQGDTEKARQVVSTTFFMLILVAIPLVVLCLSLANSIDMYALLNVDATRVRDLPLVLNVTIVMVCVSFVFKFVGNVYMALQLPAVNTALSTGGQTLGLALTTAIYLSAKPSLMLITLANTLSPLIIYMVAYAVTFHKLYPQLRPSVRFFRRDTLGTLFSLGIKFFILQVEGLVIFASSNVLISHLFSPSEVTNYQVAFRYYSILTLFFTIITTPFWSATTDAFAHGDLKWIEKSVRNIMKTTGITLIGAIVMTFLATPIYAIWVGSEVHISHMTNILMATYTLLIIYSLAHSVILNGLGKLRLQIVFTTIAAMVFIPYALALRESLGVNGVIVAMILANLPGAIANAWQYRHLMKTAKANTINQRTQPLQ